MFPQKSITLVYNFSKWPTIEMKRTLTIHQIQQASHFGLGVMIRLMAAARIEFQSDDAMEERDSQQLSNLQFSQQKKKLKTTIQLQYAGQWTVEGSETDTYNSHELPSLRDIDKICNKFIAYLILEIYFNTRFYYLKMYFEDFLKSWPFFCSHLKVTIHTHAVKTNVVGCRCWPYGLQLSFLSAILHDP